MQPTEHKSFQAPDETREFPPSGHDAWVVGDEPVTVVDWFGASNYAKAG